MKTNQIPYSAGYPLVGNLFSYSKDRLQMLQSHQERYGDTFRLRIGPKELLVISNPAHVKHIMHTNMKNYIKKTNFDQLFGQSVFTENGQSWKDQRALLQPLFSFRYLKSCIPIFVDLTRKYTASYFAQKNDGKDLRQLFMQITFETIMKTIIGLDYREKSQMLDQALHFLMSYLTDDNYKILPVPDRLNKRKQKFQFLMGQLDQLVYESIEDAKLNRDGDSFIHVMLNARDESNSAIITDQFIRDNVVTMMFAGYETTALSLSWLSYCLAINPDWQDKCIAEVQNFNIDAYDFEALKTLPTLDACLNETFRLYPPGWAWTRFAVAADEIAGHQITPGTIVLVSPYLTHRDPKLWENAKEYNPQRFMEQKLSEMDRFQFYPFGAGARTCVGMQLALLEIKFIMATLLKEFRFELVGEHPKLDARGTIFSTNGYQIKLQNY